MRITLILTYLGLAFPVFCQNISHEVQAVASGFNEDDQGRNVDWTLGVSFAKVTLNDYHLTEGFHQGSLFIPENITVDSTVHNRSEQNLALHHNHLEAIPGATGISDFNLFPNPCHDLLNLHFANLDATPQVEILVINLAGQLVLEKAFNADLGLNSIILNLKDLSSGPYFIQISSKGTLLQTLRFTKQ